MNCLVQAGPQPDRLRRQGEGPPGTETPQAAQSTPLPGSDGNGPRIYVGLCNFQGTFHTLSIGLTFVETLPYAQNCALLIIT